MFQRLFFHYLRLPSICNSIANMYFGCKTHTLLSPLIRLLQDAKYLCFHLQLQIGHNANLRTYRMNEIFSLSDDRSSQFCLSKPNGKKNGWYIRICLQAIWKQKKKRKLGQHQSQKRPISKPSNGMASNYYRRRTRIVEITRAAQIPFAFAIKALFIHGSARQRFLLAPHHSPKRELIAP